MTNPKFQLRPSHLTTGTTNTVNSPTERNFGSPLSHNQAQETHTPEEIASVEQHIDEQAKDAADHADLTRTIFGK